MTHHWIKESALFYWLFNLLYPDWCQTGHQQPGLDNVVSKRLYFHFYVARINWFSTNCFYSSSHNSWFTARLGSSQLWISYIGCITTSSSFSDCGHTVVPTWIGPQWNRTHLCAKFDFTGTNPRLGFQVGTMVRAVTGKIHEGVCPGCW